MKYGLIVPENSGLRETGFINVGDDFQSYAIHSLLIEMRVEWRKRAELS